MAKTKERIDQEPEVDKKMDESPFDPWEPEEDESERRRDPLRNPLSSKSRRDTEDEE